MRGSGDFHRVTSGGNLTPAGCRKACALPSSPQDSLDVCWQAPLVEGDGKAGQIVPVTDQENISKVLSAKE